MSFAAAQTHFGNALIDPAKAVPDGVVAPDQRIDPDRFAVYRNNIFVGLVGALDKTFPVTARLVGGDFFAGMARAFAAIEKPTTPLMFEYGAGLADFIGAFPPASGVPYLADVARLEAAWLRAYHAADAAPLDLAVLGQLGEALDAAVLTRHPAAQIIRSDHPVGSIWAAHQTEPVGKVAEWRGETVLVTRPGFDVAVTVLPDRDAAFAQALLAGEPLGKAAAMTISVDPHFDFGTALVGLVSLGAFAAVSVT